MAIILKNSAGEVIEPDLRILPNTIRTTIRDDYRWVQTTDRTTHLFTRGVFQYELTFEIFGTTSGVGVILYNIHNSIGEYVTLESTDELQFFWPHLDPTEPLNCVITNIDEQKTIAQGRKNLRLTLAVLPGPDNYRNMNKLLIKSLDWSSLLTSQTQVLTTSNQWVEVNSGSGTIYNEVNPEHAAPAFKQAIFRGEYKLSNRDASDLFNIIYRTHPGESYQISSELAGLPYQDKLFTGLLTPFDDVLTDVWVKSVSARPLSPLLWDTKIEYIKKYLVRDQYQ